MSRWEHRGRLLLPGRRIIDPRLNLPGNAHRGRPAAGPLPDISVIGSDAFNTQTSRAVPGTHAAGDMVVAFCSDNDGTMPATPTSFTSLSTMTPGADGVRLRTAWRYVTSAADTVAGLSAGSQYQLVTLRGIHPTSPIGTQRASGGESASSGTAQWDAITLVGTDSYVLLHICKAGTATPTDPAGITDTFTGQSGSGTGRWGWGIGPTSTFTAKSSTFTTVRWITNHFEVLKAT